MFILFANKKSKFWEIYSFKAVEENNRAKFLEIERVFLCYISKKKGFSLLPQRNSFDGGEGKGIDHAAWRIWVAIGRDFDIIVFAINF